MAVKNALEDIANTSGFMEDGALLHGTVDVYGHVIVLDHPTHTENAVDSPLYSLDMNPNDFFRWGYWKDEVYRHNPETIK